MSQIHTRPPADIGEIVPLVMPAAGTSAEWDMVVPAGELWEVLSIFAEFTNNSGASRRSTILFRDAVNHDIFHKRPATLIPTATTWNIQLWGGAPVYEQLITPAVGNPSFIGFLPRNLYQPGTKFLTAIGGYPNCSWGNVLFNLRRWRV